MALPAFPAPTPISVAMAGIDPRAAGVEGIALGGERVRAVLAWIARAGARAVQLDATAAGIRPRELDRSGRRDLAALLRRSEMVCSGVDAMIPAEHLLRPETADRAVASVLGAIDLAADLAGLASGAVVTRAAGTGACVGVVLDPKTPADVRHAIADRAASRGVRVADYAWPIAEAGGGAPAGADGAIGVGLDPASALAAGADAVSLAATLGARLAQARVSDVARAPGIGRVAPGSGRLDLGAYLVTLAAVGYGRHAVVDLQGLRDPGGAVGRVVGL
jgi:sugar phosphate isomerase/epimerase